MRTKLAIGVAWLVTAASGAPAWAFERELYGELLLRHTRAVDTTAGTLVDYAALRDSRDWRRVVESFADDDPGALATRDDRLAFWIDAYNVFAIDWIVREGPVESIRDLGTPLLAPVWKKDAGVVDGEPVSLDRIEHGILRPMGEPRIHAAIVCASTSCPSLRREPFRPERLDAQLDDQTRRFLADPRKGLAVDRAGRTVRLSKIFDWFAEDFGGRDGVLDFVERHAPEAWAGWIAERRGDLRVRYLDYDWSVNAVDGGR